MILEGFVFILVTVALTRCVESLYDAFVERDLREASEARNAAGEAKRAADWAAHEARWAAQALVPRVPRQPTPPYKTVKEELLAHIEGD